MFEFLSIRVEKLHPYDDHIQFIFRVFNFDHRIIITFSGIYIYIINYNT